MGKHLFVHAAHEESEYPDLNPMRNDIAFESMVAHFKKVTEKMLGT